MGGASKSSEHERQSGVHFTKNGAPKAVETIYTARQEVTNRSIGSVVTTSNSFIREMNKLSNEFAAKLCNEILPVVQTRTAN